MSYDPNNWYWLADDGRVFSSRAAALIQPADADYLAWSANGNLPTRWPVDDAGVQNDAALGDVLARYGIVVATTPDAIKVLLKSRLAEAQSRVLAVPIRVNVAASGPPVTVLADGTPATRGDLAMLALWGQVIPNGSQPWLDNADVTTILTGAQLVTLATLVGQWVIHTYETRTATIAAIEAGTITSAAEIDAIVWPSA